MTTPEKGILLIAEPFLKDPSFMRTVVLVCRHISEEGSFGFVLNKLYEKTLDELIPELDGYDLPIYVGGPVQMDTLHYIHQYPELLPDAEKIDEGIYWGGDFEILKLLIKNNSIEPSKIKFFLGYSGWSINQLDDEMNSKSWLTVQGNASLVFDTAADNIWKASLTELGGNYKMMANYPTDPQLN